MTNWSPVADVQAQREEFRELCARLLNVLPPHSVIAGDAAAYLHQLWLPWTSPPRPEFILAAGVRPPRDRARTKRCDLRGRRRLVLPDEWQWLDRLPVTTEPRTWVDLAETTSLLDLVALGDSILLENPDRSGLEQAVRRAAGRRGVVRARHALDLLDGRSRSRPESHLRCQLVLAGMPWPQVNRPIYNEVGEWLAEPDLHYEAARLAIEYNGRVHADVARSRRDITRQLDVESGHWRMIVVGPREVFDQPERTIAFVRGLLDERDPGWRRRHAA